MRLSEIQDAVAGRLHWLSDQLKTVSIGGVLKATYTYNAHRQRTRKVLTSPPTNTPGTTLYRYDPNGHLLEEIAGTAFTGSLGASIPAGTSLVTYAWKDDVPVAVIYAPGTVSNPTATERIVYLEADHLNTPRKATDSTGKVVWTWESDAFGSSLPNEDPDNDGKKTFINLRLPGQYFDAESGLHYNHHRYYDPQVGRYTQPDPLGLAAGLNPYAYVESRPLAFSDPSGLCPICPLIALGLLANEIANSDVPILGGSSARAAGKIADSIDGCTANGVANPVSGTLARVVPGNIKPSTLGGPGSVDVFVTNASELRGLTAKQIAQKLSIPESASFRVIEFPSASVQGVASPIGRSNPGFIQGGRTAGGAAEFVIPNGPIPTGAIERVVR